MTGSGSPCGACKFLRRRCVKGCVFAPYFSHEQGASHFSAIHKVFGASNVSKLLAHLPVGDRYEAALTIAYEAQARVQDPIYGCVSHIFALQQQVMNLQAQLAILKEQTGQCIINTPNNSENPNNQKFYGESSFFAHDVHSWLQNQAAMPQVDANQNNVGCHTNTPYFAGYGPIMNLNPNSAKYENPGFEEGKNASMDSQEPQSSHHEYRQWQFLDDANELQSVAFRYIQNS